MAVYARYGPSDQTIRLGLKPLVFAASLIPAALLVWPAVTHQFNANPFNAIVRDTGFWSMRFLCLTLAVTPLRWMTGWHPVMKFRRMFGLFAFFYAAIHVLAYVVFDRLAGLGGPSPSGPMATVALALWASAVEVVQRPFFAIGFAGFALMVPLAATSTVGMIRRMGGRRWQRLHRLVYPAAIASVVHTHWPLTDPFPRYGVILAVIFALRLARGYAFAPATRIQNAKRRT
jgi:methionine sulfoxide reductase heme-binding subunit